MTGYTANGTNSDYYDMGPFYYVLEKSYLLKERPRILTWLSPLEPRVQHRGVQEQRVDGIGGWLLEREEFKRWCGLGGECEGDNSVLFCYGNAGVGKTFIR